MLVNEKKDEVLRKAAKITVRDEMREFDPNTSQLGCSVLKKSKVRLHKLLRNIRQFKALESKTIFV